MGNTPHTVTILDEIVSHKRAEIVDLPDPGPARALEPRRSLAAALKGRPPVALIAEIKRRSPSRPLLRADFDPAAMAVAYAAGGACALSVLTDAHYFGGDLRHLRAAREACDLPILRKDFVVDRRQVAEAKRAGADAVLLIAAVLTDAEIVSLTDEAARWDLEVLLEVHDEAEVRRALALGAPMVGINNRDLRDFEVSLETTARLMAGIPAATRPLVVSESGIKTPHDVARLAAWGCAGMLVGEALLVLPNLTLAARELLGLPVGGEA